MLFVKKWALATRQLRSPILESSLILLVGLTLVRGLIYLSIFPPFLAPDEPAHFEAIRLIGQEKKWPTHEVYLTTPMHPQMDLIFRQYRIWTLVGLYSPRENLNFTSNLFIYYYPPQVAGIAIQGDSYLMLYHATVAPIAAMLASFDLVSQIYFLRFVSVLFATTTVVVAWSTIRFVFPEQKIFALAVTSFIVFWPMHSHITASINSDALAELIASLFFLVLVLTYRKGITIFRGIVLISLLGLATFTKPTVFFLYPTLVAVLIIYIGRRLRWANIVMGTLIAILVAMTWIGSLFLFENSNGGRSLLSLFSSPLRYPNWSTYVSLDALNFYIKSLNFAVVSFGGLFGWSNIHIPWMWVRILAVVLLCVMLGVLAFIYQNLWPGGTNRDNLSRYQKDILLIFLLAILFSAIGLVAPLMVNQSPSWGIHSRYYFPVIIPIALFCFLGVRQLIPTPFHTFLLPGWLIGWILYEIAIFWVVLIPFLFS